MSELKTDYKDQLLDTSVNTERKFNIVDSDGNVVANGISLEDITSYSQEGDSFGAADLNRTNSKINDLADSLAKVKTYVDGEGNLHFVDSEGADSVLPFSNSFKELVVLSMSVNTYMAILINKTEGKVVSSDNTATGSYFSCSRPGSGKVLNIKALKNGKYFYATSTSRTNTVSINSNTFSANSNICNVDLSSSNAGGYVLAWI